MSDAIRPTGDTNAERADRGETDLGAERRDPTRATERRDGERTAEQRDAEKASRESGNKRFDSKTFDSKTADRAADSRNAEDRTAVPGSGKATPFGSDRAASSREADRSTGRPEQSARPVHAPEPPPSASDRRRVPRDAENGSLVPHDESDKFSLRLQHAVTGFVDEPRSAVEEADHVLEEVAARFTEAVTKRRDTLHGSWESSASADTEQLRLALRDYRELTERLLHI
nr:hypothetical protein OG999_37610 [Streptomyces sp. NBC_00886]